MPPELNRHWTERSLDDFLYRVGADFVRQLEAAMQNDPDATRASLARKLGVSKGRISQVLNNPGNLTLRKMIEYARAVGHKVTVLAYYDGDNENSRGPIPAQVFTGCWQNAGRPFDFFELNERRIHYYTITPDMPPQRGANDADHMVFRQINISGTAATQ